VLGLGVHASRVVATGVGENVGGPAVELASLDVDDLELHLDAETRAFGGVEVDLHQFSPRGSLVPGWDSSVGNEVRLGVVANATRCTFVTTGARISSDVGIAARRTVPQAQCFVLRQVLAGHAARIDRCSGPPA